MRRGKKTKGLRDMDFNSIYDDTFDFEPRTIHPFCNIDCERIQSILKKNGKVTWGDVYAPWLKNYYWRELVKKKGYIWGEEIQVLETDPNTPMKCVLDIHFGDWYWIPKDEVISHH
ncbi:MAG: hypothetical protein J1E16_00420 [Muribaculaceae bacterium]|nr:hypothetical protein [Muribaculaceae bacterium]